MGNNLDTLNSLSDRAIESKSSDEDREKVNGLLQKWSSLNLVRAFLSFGGALAAFQAL